MLPPIGRPGDEDDGGATRPATQPPKLARSHVYAFTHLQVRLVPLRCSLECKRIKTRHLRRANVDAVALGMAGDNGTNDTLLGSRNVLPTRCRPTSRQPSHSGRRKLSPPQQRTHPLALALDPDLLARLVRTEDACPRSDEEAGGRRPTGTRLKDAGAELGDLGRRR